jgi:hypothetical protein
MLSTSTRTIHSMCTLGTASGTFSLFSSTDLEIVNNLKNSTETANILKAPLYITQSVSSYPSNRFYSPSTGNRHLFSVKDMFRTFRLYHELSLR